MTLDLLVFAPHPDDAELCCGGWLALAADRGQRAGIVDLTRGELATNGTPEIRAREAEAAAEVLGLAVRENLALPDGGLHGEDAEQVDAVVEVLRRLTPTLIAAPWIQARHPDHRAAGHLVRRAHFLAGLVNHRPDLGAPHRPRLLAYPMRVDTRVDLVVDTTAVWERKHQAVSCHESQLKGATRTLINGGLHAFETRDRYWGASIGTAYGEPLILGTPVPVPDPIEHFAAHPSTPLLVPNR